MLPMAFAIFHVGGNLEVIGDFTVIRLLILVGVGRAIVSGSLRFSLSNPFDRIMAILAAWLVISSIGHPDSLTNPYVYRLGLVWNYLGSYLYAKAYLPAFNRESLLRYCLLLSVFAIPFSAALLAEKKTQKNSYSMLGARSATAGSREGKVRAQGTFGHPILAGTVGATTLPLAFFIFRRGRKKIGLLAIAACVAIVIASASSGPLAALATTMLGIYAWRWQRHASFMIKAGLASLVFLQLVMTRDVWHLMSMMDLVGGSTGWHRARLIDRAVEYLGDWWLFGTDYTRHWMATGVSWSPNHVDFTNHYIALGVVSGLPTVILFATLITKSVRTALLALRTWAPNSDESYLIWCLLISLSAHVISMFSIDYFDQNYVLMYSLFAIFSNAKEKLTNELNNGEPSMPIHEIGTRQN
ncbi:hypothetical protein VDG1235_217 [Verrucomicrobiia bacterium DG1235]|nr:hypothetical protein VDG1235_217 [Verrucomicrobiae bacterium DG1235]